VLWRLKQAAPESASQVVADSRSPDYPAPEPEVDHGAEATPTENADVASAVAQLKLNARIEVVDGDGRVVMSRPIFTSAVLPTHAGTPRDMGADLRSGRALGAGGFVAVDFETATGSRASACAVAVAAVEDGNVTAVSRWLIRPPGNEYDGFNISTHGIRPDMTADKPSMAEAWPEVYSALEGLPVVAHYAAFDTSVLRHSLAAGGHDWPELTYYCTRNLARRAWPGKLSYRLPDLAYECGLTFDHHEPGSDAATAAELAIACCGVAEQADLREASRALGVFAGQLGRYTWTPSGGMPPRLTDLTPTVDEIPEESIFKGQTVVFTGTLTSGLARADAAQLVVNAGGNVAAGVSKKVNYLVLGLQDARMVHDGEHSSKMLKAAALQAAGHPIELLAEDDFYQMLPE